MFWVQQGVGEEKLVDTELDIVGLWMYSQTSPKRPLKGAVRCGL